MATSALLDKYAAGNSLQEIKPAFGLSHLFAVGFRRRWEKERLLHHKLQATFPILISHNETNQAEQTLPP